MNVDKLLKTLDAIGCICRNSDEGEQIAAVLAADGLTMADVTKVIPLHTIINIYNLGIINGFIIEMKRKEWEQCRDIKEQ